MASASPGKLAAVAQSISTEVEQRKFPLLYEAAGNFLDRGPGRALPSNGITLRSFAALQAAWLDDYALYAVLRRKFKTGAWTEWPEPLRRRDPQALAQAAAEHARALALEQVLQFAFSPSVESTPRGCGAQRNPHPGRCRHLRQHGFGRRVWVHPEIFELDEDLKPIRIAGVPPDYFSPTGQRWGNPLYRWDVLAETGFAWWIDRIRRANEIYDIMRLDHFRGFEAYWAIPAEEETAVNGEWIKAPGLALFRALEQALGPLPLVAEDLGMITPEVDALRSELGMPGMKVLQFGFADKGAHIHLPHRFTPATVAYTGTHDNDTTQGWWNAAGNARTRRPLKRSPVLSAIAPCGRSSAPLRAAWPRWPSFRRRTCWSWVPKRA